MKKLIGGLAIVFILFFASLYIFIPGQIEIDETVMVKASPQATSRILSKIENWQKWWPQINLKRKADSVFPYHHSIFSIDEKLYNGFKIDILNGPDYVRSRLSLIPLSIDSVQLQWSGLLRTSANPVRRIRQFWRAKETETDLSNILSSLNSYMSKQENVYGMQIRRELVKDTLLLSQKVMFRNYPTTSLVYVVVQSLKDYIRNKGANETNYPMLHVDQLAPTTYQAMVAIPLNREIPVDSPMAFKRMVPGYILVSEIKGGPATIEKAFDEMRNFMSDFSRISPAIPFESMVTDRSKEADTAKWI